MQDWPNLVESHLTAIQVLESERRIEISLVLPGGQKHEITLEGVDRFFLNSMRETNILERIRVWDRRSNEAELKSAIAWLITGSVGDYDKAFLPVIENTIQRVRAGEQVLLEISPIYGVEVLALARSVQFR